MIDILQPFRNAASNRDEVFLINYEGFIVNQSANLVYAIFDNLEKYCKAYPGISMFLNMNAREIYESTKLFHPFNLLFSMSIVGTENMDNLNALSDQIVKDIILLKEIDVCRFIIPTMFSFALNKMMSERCCTKAYILREIGYADWEVEHMRNMFGEHGAKIEYIDGDFFDFYMTEKKNLTTIFVNDYTTLLKIYGVPNHEEFTSNQLFSLLLSSDILELEESTKQYRYNSVLNTEMLERSDIHVSTIGCNAFNEVIGLDAPAICGG